MNATWLKDCDDSAAPSRLRSLLDIMKPFTAIAFLRYAGIGGMAAAQTMIDKRFPKLTGQYDESQTASRDRFLAALEHECVTLDLIASLATIRKIRSILTKGNAEASVADIAPLDIELQGRIFDELEQKILFSLSIKESEYYRNSCNCWDDILSRFPESLTDVEEASKCFALSRYAASVFHSTQVVESGLIELGTYIGVNDPRSGWTAVTNKLTAIIKKTHGDRTDFEKRNFDFLEQICGTTEALKNAWRNKIGHAQGRLTLLNKDFTPDIAEEILFASRAFMRRLADGLPPLEIKSGS
jgi:hypothetical protein